MIRKATIDDIPAIRAMASVVFPDTYKNILSPEQLDYMMDWMYSEQSLKDQMTDGNIFLISEGKGYTSFRYVGRSDDDTALFHLEKLYVMPAFQGQGIGSELFEAVVKTAGSLYPGKIRIELNVNRNNRAVSFYEHLGMSKARQGDFPIGKGFYMNDYIMSIEIENNM